MLEQLIKYFVYKTKGHITKTQLINFLYLADLYSVKWTGKQFTELDWCYYHYGLCNQDIDAILNQMNGKEIAQESNSNYTFIRLGIKANIEENLNLPISIQLMLDNIRREWAGSGKIKQLSDYVYNTAPMLKVQDIHKPEEKIKLNLYTEREKLVSELGL